MSLIKASSLPAICSPIATHPSFADMTAMPFKTSWTLICSPVSRYIVDPPMLLACSLTVMVSFMDISPRSIASIARSIVMIFVTLAMGRFSCGAFENSTVPVLASTNTALGAVNCIAVSSPVSAFLEEGSPFSVAKTGAAAAKSRKSTITDAIAFRIFVPP